MTPNCAAIITHAPDLLGPSGGETKHMTLYRGAVPCDVAVCRADSVTSYLADLLFESRGSFANVRKTPRSCRKRKLRSVPQTADRVLDAPDAVDDFCKCWVMRYVDFSYLHCIFDYYNKTVAFVMVTAAGPDSMQDTDDNIELISE